LNFIYSLNPPFGNVIVAKITSLPHTGFKKSLKAVIILSLSPSVGVSGSPISFLICS
jgi:hypothetical protein